MKRAKLNREQLGELKRVYYKYRQFLFKSAINIMKDEYKAERMIEILFVKLIKSGNIEPVLRQKDILGILETLMYINLTKPPYSFTKELKISLVYIHDSNKVSSERIKEILDKLEESEVEECLHYLTLWYHNIMCLRYKYDLSIDEIASYLYYSRRKMKSYLIHGNQSLYQVIRHYFPERIGL